MISRAIEKILPYVFSYILLILYYFFPIIPVPLIVLALVNLYPNDKLSTNRDILAVVSTCGLLFMLTSNLLCVSPLIMLTSDSFQWMFQIVVPFFSLPAASLKQSFTIKYLIAYIIAAPFIAFFTKQSLFYTLIAYSLLITRYFYRKQPLKSSIYLDALFDVKTIIPISCAILSPSLLSCSLFFLAISLFLLYESRVTKPLSAATLLMSFFSWTIISFCSSLIRFRKAFLYKFFATLFKLSLSFSDYLSFMIYALLPLPLNVLLTLASLVINITEIFFLHWGLGRFTLGLLLNQSGTDPTLVLGFIRTTPRSLIFFFLIQTFALIIAIALVYKNRLSLQMRIKPILRSTLSTLLIFLFILNITTRYRNPKAIQYNTPTITNTIRALSPQKTVAIATPMLNSLSQFTFPDSDTYLPEQLFVDPNAGISPYIDAAVTFWTDRRPLDPLSQDETPSNIIHIIFERLTTPNHEIFKEFMDQYICPYGHCKPFYGFSGAVPSSNSLHSMLTRYSGNEVYNYPKLDKGFLIPFMHGKSQNMLINQGDIDGLDNLFSSNIFDNINVRKATITVPDRLLVAEAYNIYKPKNFTATNSYTVLWTYDTHSPHKGLSDTDNSWPFKVLSNDKTYVGDDRYYFTSTRAVVSFINSFKDTPMANNTLFIIHGDHGYYWGNANHVDCRTIYGTFFTYSNNIAKSFSKMIPRKYISLKDLSCTLRHYNREKFCLVGTSLFNTPRNITYSMYPTDSMVIDDDIALVRTSEQEYFTYERTSHDDYDLGIKTNWILTKKSATSWSKELVDIMAQASSDWIAYMNNRDFTPI